jgi:hypothetical protein
MPYFTLAAYLLDFRHLPACHMHVASLSLHASTI